MMRSKLLLCLFPLFAACSGPPEAHENFFIETTGRHPIIGDQVYVEVFEQKSGKLNYRVYRTWTEGRRQWQTHNGPGAARIEKEGKWFFYVETPQRVWVSYSENLTLLEWDDRKDGAYGVIEACSGGPAWHLVHQIPDAVYERLPSSVVTMISEAQQTGDGNEGHTRP